MYKYIDVDYRIRSIIWHLLYTYLWKNMLYLFLHYAITNLPIIVNTITFYVTKYLSIILIAFWVLTIIIFYKYDINHAIYCTVDYKKFIEYRLIVKWTKHLYRICTKVKLQKVRKELLYLQSMGVIEYHLSMCTITFYICT